VGSGWVWAFLGIGLAVLVIGAVTLPYATAWVSLTDEGQAFHFVHADGETYVWSLGDAASHPSRAFVNVTCACGWPKAAVEARRDLFSMELVFLVVFHPNVTEFICDEIEVNFRGPGGSTDYYGRQSLSFFTGDLVDFYRSWRDAGHIAPFSANVTLTIDPSSWPPIRSELASMLYFVGRIATAPVLTLRGRLSTNATDRVTYQLSTDFDLTSYETGVYRFNYPPTLWLAYGGSVLLVIVALVYLRRRFRSGAIEARLDALVTIALSLRQTGRKPCLCPRGS
jgi:hypothetical protein